MCSDNISVIIPTYNRSDTIIRSVDSVLSQEYDGKIEVIIVDDGSGDDTIAKIDLEYGNKVRVIKLDKHSGANKARNVGVANAQYDYVAFQDSDDQWHKNKLFIEMLYMKKNHADIVACSFMIHERKKYSVHVKQIPGSKIEAKDLIEKLYFNNFIGTSTILAKKMCLTDITFNEELTRFQDWDLMIRILKKYRFYFINECLMDAFCMDDGITHDNKAGMFSLNIILNENLEYFENHKAAHMMMLRRMGYYSLANSDYKHDYYADAIGIYPFDIRLRCLEILFRIKKLQEKS